MGVRRDVFYANWLCNKRNVLNREKIYFETNEDLDKIFKDIDFSDKDVLSVLASSDQLFKLNSLDTKSIETFDKKYDIAVISNILEWTHGDSRYIERLENN